MTGPLALHGGGEFQPGDEPFLRRLLELGADARGTDARPIHVELVTSAVARHGPEATFAYASAALTRVAEAAGYGALRIEHARIVDATSAADPGAAARIEAADLVYLPGGDPDAVVSILDGSRALQAIEAARDRGAVVAGASAGAMAMGALTWTRSGHVPGFGWAGLVIVVPHATPARMAGHRGVVDALPGGESLTILGLPERGGVIGMPGSWRVVGSGGAWAWAPGGADVRHLPEGGQLTVSGTVR